MSALSLVLRFLYLRQWWRLHRACLVWARFVWRVEWCQMQPLELLDFHGAAEAEQLREACYRLQIYVASSFGIPKRLL